MAKCYLGELLLRQDVIWGNVLWQNVIWRDITEPEKSVQGNLSHDRTKKTIKLTDRQRL